MAKAKDETIWGKTQEEFAEYVSTLENDAETRTLTERRIATAIFSLPEDLPEEGWEKVSETMAPIEPEELAHLDHYVRMADEHNARYDEIEQSDLVPIMEKYKAKLNKQLGTYASNTNGVEAYFIGIQKAVKREGKKVAAELDLGIDKKTLDNVLEGVSIDLARMSDMVGGGILTVLRDAAVQQRFGQELEKWKAKHPKDILVTYNAEIEARKEIIEGIAGKYFMTEQCGPSCADCGETCD